MQGRKNIVTTVFFVVSAFTLTVYSACKEKYTPTPDSCAGVICQNNGVCIQGECDCTAGYTGPNCENKANAPYIGKWAVNQEVVSTNGNPVSGMNTSYQMEIAEDPSGVTVLRLSGFMGDASFNNVKIRIGASYELLKNNSGVYVDTEVPANSSSFIFTRYQPLGQSNKQLVLGEGSINSLGTQLNGEFYVAYADTSGVVEDRITFSATFVN